MSGLIYHVDKRRVIPKLERLGNYDFPKLSLPERHLENVKGSDNYDLDNELYKWKTNKTKSKAGELISAAIVDGRLDKVEEVITYLRKKDPLDPFVDELINSDQDIFNDPHGANDIKKRIGENRKKLIFEPRDSLTWIDQAINFVEVGERNKALEAVTCAVNLNSSSSFIVRNAARIYSLFGDNTEAIKVLKKSEYYKYDPLILAAEISFSELDGRRTRGIDYGLKVISEDKYTSHQMTELNSAIATIKQKNGDIKSSNLLFDKALISPNSNSLAQSLWYAKNDIPENKLNAYKGFGEIQTHLYTMKQNYEQAFEHSKIWINQEKFSVRPYNLASYLSGVLLEDYDSAYNIIKEGALIQNKLKNNLTPDEKSGFLNDLAYFLLKGDRLKDSEKYISKIIGSSKRSNFERDIDNVKKATLGLYFYRKEEIHIGRRLYRSAIDYFSKKKQVYNMKSAFLNYIDEEIRVTDDTESLNKLKKELDFKIGGNTQDDLIYFKKLVTRNLDNKMQKITMK